MSEYDKPKWIKVSVDDLTTPKPGRICKGPAWWAITDDGFALFYKSMSSPQCNADKRIVERVRPDCTPRFIEMAFVDHNCGDYV